MSDWIPVDDKLPEANKLVLARGTTHSGVALAHFNSSDCSCCSCISRWEVQPFKSPWYTTEKGILEWMPIPDQKIIPEIICMMPTSSKSIYFDVRYGDKKKRVIRFCRGVWGENLSEEEEIELEKCYKKMMGFVTK